MVHFFNPRINECHCTVLCQYFGDQFMLPKACCKKGNPKLLRSHIEAVKEDLHTHQKVKRELEAHRLPGSNLKKLPSDLTKATLPKLLVWQHQIGNQNSPSVYQ